MKPTKLRKDIPYVPNTGNACALACYTMAAKYFFPETTYEELAIVTRHKPKYVIWEMPFWNWIMEKGISVTTYDIIDYKLWAEEGVSGLQKAVSEDEFKFYCDVTYDIESYSDDIKANFQNPLFNHHKRNPTWDDLIVEFKSGGVCNIVLNWKALDGVEGFGLHQVVVLDISDSHIEFHDPRGATKPQPNRIETIEHFKHAWLEATNDPSLCVYKKYETD